MAVIAWTRGLLVLLVVIGTAAMPCSVAAQVSPSERDIWPTAG